MSHLQVDDTTSVPFMEVRYPKEEGQFKSEQLQARSKWFQTHLNMSRNDADALAFTEMDHIFQLEPG